MNRFSARVTAAAAAAAALAFACSSSGSKGGSGGGFPYSGPSCPTSAPADAGVSASCSSCLSGCYDNSCVTADCSDYFSCYCPCQPSDSACVMGCQSKITQACSSCASGVAKCIEGCASSCSPGSSSSSGGSGSSSGSGGGPYVYSCDSPGHGCAANIYDMPVDASTFEMTCTQMGETPGNGCPAAGVQGCCKITVPEGTSETCYYEGCNPASNCMMGCAAQHGTWSTTP